MSNRSATQVDRPSTRPPTSPGIQALTQLAKDLARMPITGPRGVVPLGPPPPPAPDLGLLWAQFSAATAAHRHEEAAVLARSALQHVPQSRRWRLGLMLALIGVHRGVEAETLGRALFEEWPDRPEIQRAMALAHLCIGNRDLAQAWAELAERDSKSPDDTRLAEAVLARVSAPEESSPAQQRELITDLIDVRAEQRRLNRCPIN